MLQQAMGGGGCIQMFCCDIRNIFYDNLIYLFSNIAQNWQISYLLDH